MIFTETKLKGCYTIELSLITDDRGGFARTFCKKEFAKIGHSKEFVQFNQSYNTKKGTLRGMHYQQPPFKEEKLVRCIKGAIMDVVVDIRKDSPTFLQHITVELSEQNKKMIYIPGGFAHGFQTLEDNTEVVYHHTEYYTPDSEAGINYSDSALKISWPLAVSIISDRDKNFPFIDTNFKGI